MKRASRFERANPLEILTLEIKPNLWRCRRTTTHQIRSWLRSRRDCVEGRVCEERRMVDIWLDESVCFGDAGWGEWEVGFGFCHFVFFFPPLSLGFVSLVGNVLNGLVEYKWYM
jgi:hypothetical protein